jgi:hypothetical protein
MVGATLFTVTNDVAEMAAPSLPPEDLARLEISTKSDGAHDYRAIPYDGMSFVGKVIQSHDDYRLALNKITEWDGKYKGVTKYNVGEIYEQIVNLMDRAGKLFLEGITSSFHNKSKFEQLLDYMSDLPLNLTTKDFFGETISKSHELGFEEGMQRLLRRKISPEGGWSGSVGETPPAFIEKKQIFSEFLQSAPPGILRNTLRECLNSVEKMIEEHNDDDENRFHSR